MTPTSRRPHLAREQAFDLLQRMIRLRRFEARCAELHRAAPFGGVLRFHDGEEAVMAGTISALGPHDRLVVSRREHAHALMRGIPMGAILAEMYGKAEGCAGGRGGAMHLFSREHEFHGGNTAVGGGLSLAVGLALADSLRNADRITACFFGDDAVADGMFHESLDLAARWKLPVLFVCENTRHAMGQHPRLPDAERGIARKLACHGVDAETVDGTDVVAVEAATRKAVTDILTTGRPKLLECEIPCIRPHPMSEGAPDSDGEGPEQFRNGDPIIRFRTFLAEAGLVRGPEIEQLERQAEEEIAAAVAFAEAGTWEPVETLTRFTVADQQPPAPRPSPSGDRIRTTYREAARAAISEAMERLPDVILMGRGVGGQDGCHAVTEGLLERFGPERVRDTPVSDSGLTSAAIGAAVAGMRPIVEVMTANSSLLAFDRILNRAATLRHMSNNQFGVPLVIRMATGAGRQLSAQHAQGLQGWLAHIPGVRVLAPATLEDARGMLWTALEDPDPVIILESVMLHGHAGEIDAHAGAVDIHKAAVRRRGHDISLITHGVCLWRSLEAAAQLAAEGIEAEVIDLRVLRPLDTATIIDSVSRTRRVLVIDDGWRAGSLAAEIGMRIAEDAFYELDAPLARLCSAESPLPYARHLAEAAMPQTEGIVARVRAMFGRV